MEALWRIELLGGLRAVSRDREIARFRTQKTGLLLAYLALYPERSYARDALVDLFWTDWDPAAGRQSLRQALSSLRHQLEPPGVPAGAVLVTDRASVRLNPAAYRTDVAEFERALEAAIRRDQKEPCRERLQAAVALYRGELIPGCVESWALTERGRLAEAFYQALERLSQSWEQAGDLAAAATWARRAVSADPLREEGHRRLICLLASSGEPESARRHYAELEQLLERELGTVPEPATAILVPSLNGREQLSPACSALALEVSDPDPDRERAPGAVGLPPSAPLLPGYLPPPFTRYFGREEEIARLGELLGESTTETRRHGEEHGEEQIEKPSGSSVSASPCPPCLRGESLPERPRLVTLTGPGGSGKTRLALEVARRLWKVRGGAIWFVPLADLMDARLILPVLRDALDLPRAAGADPLDQVASFLSLRSSLLLLDNFEQLVSEGAPVVRALLERVPTLTCLVTSRQCLGLEAEQEWPVVPLPVPGEEAPGAASLLAFPSVQLFVDRAQAVRPDFQVTGANAAAVAEMCRRLEGLPLAIELAAARVRMLTPSQMVERLSPRFELLVSRRRDVAPRHSSLRAALDWSYELLPPDLRRLFTRLAVFRGGFTLAAVEVVCEAPRALDGLEQLQECSFVAAQECGNEVRYRMLETLREFAREHVDAEEWPRLERRHAAYYRELAEKAGANLWRAEQAAWLDRLESEHDNLRAALAWSLTASGDPGEGLGIAGAVWPFWEIRGHAPEGRNWVEAVLSRSASAPRAMRIRALWGAGHLSRYAGDYERAMTLHEESLALCREWGDRGAIGMSLYFVADTAHVQGDYRWAHMLVEESLALCREARHAEGIVSGLLLLGHLSVRKGDSRQATAHRAEAVALARQMGDRVHLAHGLGELGYDALCRSEYDRAQSFFDEAQVIYRELKEQPSANRVRWYLGNLAAVRGEFARARALLEENLDLCRQHGEKDTVSDALASLGLLAAGQGDLATARARQEEALAIRRELGEEWRIASSLAYLADLALAEGKETQARSLYDQSQGLFREVGDRRGLAWVSHGLARADLIRGDLAPARASCQEALRLWHETGDRRRVAQCLETLAAVVRTEGAPEQALRWLGAAATLREAIGAPATPVERVRLEREEEAARRALGAEASAPWARGRQTPLDQIIREALRDA